MRKEVSESLNAIEQWARTRNDIAGMLLVGSHARGEARPDSDVDIMILGDDPARFLGDRAWIHRFGNVESCGVEDWGAVTSLRVTYTSGIEVEFGIAHASWASLDPLDAGSRRVLEDGYRVLFDPRGALGRLREHLT